MIDYRQNRQCIAEHICKLAQQYAGDKVISSDGQEIMPASEHWVLHAKHVWKNLRDGGGLRLSPWGRSMFHQAQIEYYRFRLEALLKSQQNLTLDKYMACPYYVGYHNTRYGILEVYDSRIASMITLHGDADSYINSLANMEKQL